MLNNNVSLANNSIPCVPVPCQTCPVCSLESYELLKDPLMISFASLILIVVSSAKIRNVFRKVLQAISPRNDSSIAATSMSMTTHPEFVHVVHSRNDNMELSTSSHPNFGTTRTPSPPPVNIIASD